jgi:hypothetical protein
MTDQELMAGKNPRERIEAPIKINVVDEQSPAGPQSGPSPIQLEAHIAFCMPTIMDEEVDVPELRE